MKKKITIALVGVTLIAVLIATFIILKNNMKNKEEPKKEIKPELTEIDKFYLDEVLKGYTDIRKLPENYDSDKAKIDNCFVNGTPNYNENLYYEFKENYKNNVLSFIRILKHTTEGDVIISDVKYDPVTNKLNVVIDNTRDKIKNIEDRTITLKTFDKMVEYEYQDYTYWIVYNGKINDETFNSENTYILAKIK